VVSLGIVIISISKKAGTSLNIIFTLRAFVLGPAGADTSAYAEVVNTGTLAEIAKI